MGKAQVSPVAKVIAALIVEDEVFTLEFVLMLVEDWR